MKASVGFLKHIYCSSAPLKMFSGATIQVRLSNYFDSFMINEATVVEGMFNLPPIVCD
jgi:hypothetical protein